jgi:hypothetical protein
MNTQWVEITYHDGDSLHFVYGTIPGTIEECILSKSPEDWIRLDNVRWLSESGTAMEKLQDDMVGTDSYFYLRSRTIVRVAPIRRDVEFWGKGEPPVMDFVESSENN